MRGKMCTGVVDAPVAAYRRFIDQVITMRTRYANADCYTCIDQIGGK
jgi:hypothetical protein